MPRQPLHRDLQWFIVQETWDNKLTAVCIYGKQTKYRHASNIASFFVKVFFILIATFR
jgi:hypothetical protein